MKKTTKSILVVAITLVTIAPFTLKSDDIDALVQKVKIKKDEVNDLISTILDVSPGERAKLAKYKAAHGIKSKSSQGGAAAVPNLGIPESQLLEASSKFPKDFVGKYVYGPVSFKSLSVEGNDACIMFTAKGYRGFKLYTKDPNIIQAFSQFGWGTKFSIPKEFPLRILTKDFTFYVVRLPFDQDTTEHSMRELFQDFGKDMKSIIDETGNRVRNDLNGVPNY
jgi:hypothetical protein